MARGSGLELVAAMFSFSEMAMRSSAMRLTGQRKAYCIYSLGNILTLINCLFFIHITI